VAAADMLVCLANEVIPDREQLWVHSVVFFLATLANAAIGAATVSGSALSRPRTAVPC
jgi:hypothetical protein